MLTAGIWRTAPAAGVGFYTEPGINGDVPATKRVHIHVVGVRKKKPLQEFSHNSLETSENQELWWETSVLPICGPRLLQIHSWIHLQLTILSGSKRGSARVGEVEERCSPSPCCFPPLFPAKTPFSCRPLILGFIYRIYGQDAEALASTQTALKTY